MFLLFELQGMVLGRGRLLDVSFVLATRNGIGKREITVCFCCFSYKEWYWEEGDYWMFLLF